MSEFRFFSYTDFAFHTNRSENLLNLPFGPYHPTKRTTSEEISHELNVPYTVFEVLVAIFAIIGNLMVIIVFQRDRKLRRRTNYYIVSLAMADFLVGSLGVPFAVLASIGLPTNLHACLFTVSLLVVLCTTSIFCLVAVSVDRYWAILYPMAYSRNVRTKTAIGIISMCWVAGAFVGFLPLFGWHAMVGPNQACLFVEVMDYNYLVFLYFATIITPALLMLAFYAHIYRVIVKQVRQIVTMNPSECSRRSSSMQMQGTPTRMCNGGTMLRVLGAARKRDVKATQNLSIIVLFFMICWIPLYTINCVKAFCPDFYVHPKLTFFCIILSHLNSAVNPVLYAYHLKDFRAALKNLILKILGIEVEQPVEAVHRFSVASQHRLQSIDNKRASLQARIYIDSPVWLRQQQSLKHSHNQMPQITSNYDVVGVSAPTIANSLGRVHHTVATVTASASDIDRNMWNIIETSSGVEKESVSYNKDKLSSTATEGHDSPYSYDNRIYNSSPEDLEYDEVFINAYIDNHENAFENSRFACNMRDKLRSDDDSLKNQKNQRILTDSPFSNNEIPKSRMVLASSEKTVQSVSPVNGVAVPLQLNRKSSLSVSSMNCRGTSFVIGYETDPLSPVHKRSSRPPEGLRAKASRRISRSCSCTNYSPKKGDRTAHQLSFDSGSNNSSSNNNNTNTTNNLNYYSNLSEKFSPLKVMSSFIFPPIVKHSSLFQIITTSYEQTVTVAAETQEQLSQDIEDSITTSMTEVSERERASES